MICTTNDVDYSTIRKAMCEGVGTGEDCGRCKPLIANIIELGR